jgi:glycosyltransferase involved in cell wall biosynthesis
LCDYSGIDYIEIPWSIDSWFKRLKCEYITMHRISRQLPETDLWFSLHDTTPRVVAKRQAVYCHTSFPFMKPTWQDFRMDAKIPLFSMFTRFAYRWNVRKNRYLVVQSQWMRKGMAALLHLPEDRFIVFPPAFRSLPIPSIPLASPPAFLFPSTPDVHKNFETLCEAARMLEDRLGKDRFRVVLTVKGDENRYAAWLRREWGDVVSIDFHGLMSRGELARAYGEAACLVFPSRAETWGLPISEFLPTGKPMILADLPYAHETAAGASWVAYFPVTDVAALASIMENYLCGGLMGFQGVPVSSFQPPHVSDWEMLFRVLLDNKG